MIYERSPIIENFAFNLRSQPDPLLSRIYNHSVYELNVQKDKPRKRKQQLFFIRLSSVRDWGFLMLEINTDNTKKTEEGEARGRVGRLKHHNNGGLTADY